jgi:signal peptidase
MSSFVREVYETLSNMKPRQYITQIVQLGLVVCSALAIWKSLMIVTLSESPIVVVLSGSMETTMFRGDLLFLTNYATDPIRVGEITVYQIPGKPVPIVHRALKVHEKSNGYFNILTKGDNNEVFDQAIYQEGYDKYLNWLDASHIMGRARGFLPYLGMVTIIMNEKPAVKYILIGFLALLVITDKEE